MNNDLTAIARYLSLVVVAIISAIIWRIEIEFHGWSGLKWLSYFHWSVPVAVGLFALWLGIFSSIRPRKKRLTAVGIFLIFSVVAYPIVTTSLSYYFITGPSAFILIQNPLFPLYRNSIYIVYPGILAWFWWAAKYFQLRLSPKIYLLSSAFYFGAIPLALFLLRITNHVGEADLIHTIKSGLIFPFLVIGLGIPFLQVRTND